jgi:hypothetical protein
MTYTEKAYIAAGQALARATTEQAAKARARILDLMVNAEQPADQARARQLAANGEEEPPDRVGPHLFFLTGCEADPSLQFFKPNQKTKCSHSTTTHSLGPTFPALA